LQDNVTQSWQALAMPDFYAWMHAWNEMKMYIL